MSIILFITYTALSVFFAHFLIYIIIIFIVGVAFHKARYALAFFCGFAFKHQAQCGLSVYSEAHAPYGLCVCWDHAV